MSSSTIILIAIIAAVFLAFLMVVTTSRRRDTDRATGRLSRETIQKDRSEEIASEVLARAGRKEQRNARAHDDHIELRSLGLRCRHVGSHCLPRLS